MSKRISFKILFVFVAFVLLVAVLFNYVNYSTIKTWNENVNIERSKSESYEITNRLSDKFNNFEISVRESALSTSSNEESGYYLKELSLKFPSIKNIFFYDGEFNVEYALENSEDEFQKIENSISKYTILNSKMWDVGDELIYVYHFKVSSGKFSDYRISILLNINEFISDIVESEEGYDVYDSYFNKVNKGDFSEEIVQINSKKESMINGYYGAGIEKDSFYSYGSIDVDTLDLFYYYSKDNSEYKSMIRAYYIRNITLTLFLMILSTLVAWRLISMFHREILKAISNEKYQEHEFSVLDRKLKVAIHWIDDVMNHYSELGHLKEELVEIIETLPKEGELHDKKDLIKIIKEKRSNRRSKRK